jgi:maleate isomerase
MRPTHRVGLVIPAVNTVLEPFLAAVLGPGTSLHTQRVPVAASPSVETVEAMDRHGLDAVTTVAACRPDLIVYACTASGYCNGPDHDAALVARFEAAVGVPCLSAAAAEVEALERLGVRSVCSLTPYPAELGRLAASFLERQGIEVRASCDLGVTDTFALAGVEPALIADAARRLWDGAGGALVVSCLNFRAHEVRAELETDLGCPVVTAPDAVLAAVERRLAAVTSNGAGR